MSIINNYQIKPCICEKYGFYVIKIVLILITGCTICNSGFIPLRKVEPNRENSTRIFVFIGDSNMFSHVDCRTNH